MKTDAFLLTRQWRDTSSGIEYEFWAASPEGPLRILYSGQEAVFFVERSSPTPPKARRGEVELSNMAGAPVDALYFRSQRNLREARQYLTDRQFAVFESDIKPSDRFFMERFVMGGLCVQGEALRRDGYLELLAPVMRPAEFTPDLRVVSLDIETSDLDGDLYSIAVTDSAEAMVFMCGTGPAKPGIHYCATETLVIEAFLEWIARVDPDAIIGWNVIDFDLNFLAEKCKKFDIPFALGRARSRTDIIPPATRRQTSIARVPGRVVLDGIALLRLGMWNFERFSLEHVARELLGRGKLVDDVKNRLQEIRAMFRDDKPKLAAYNLEDCQLVLDIFAKAKLIPFAIARSKLTGLTLDRQGGSVAAFDFNYLPRLHRKGCVAHDVGYLDEAVASPGGYILESKPGIFENVLVLDFKSLYPSIIRTFKIDPLGMSFPAENPVPGFGGAVFSRERHILPGLIETLWTARDEAKRAQDAPLSQAIKILMNSFYGVLGTPGCRFFHPNLVASITRRGHELITRSRDFIHEQGYEVIYGDTDSLFVLIGAEHSPEECAHIGSTLATSLNSWWENTLGEEYALECHLEIEFEIHFLRYFMPTIRGSEKGSKKRYAGYVLSDNGEPELVFKGLEAVRTDWTPLAREFQRELYRRVFFEEPFEQYVSQITEDLLAGHLDAKLLYRKRLRRALDDYKKNVPPHVQAARKLERPEHWVTYAITLNGPEPAEKLHSPFDYAHYMERQLAPVADSILRFLNTDFAQLTEKQMDMFRTSPRGDPD